ncbi:nucleobase-ascorbate transporter 4 isoform X3 [Prosopis cineraria]|uniref:nucleobase-ascorbate transporter 4 isoform X3 n=1 Tax=Prosopis cineraria TaxID=364024 RepID=UPI00240FCA46|nr:nucleobase-ascorbate transporter 4 isoform X3 [Prosopis cineraria]
MAQAAKGGGAKGDEFQPHPVKEQLPGVLYCLSSSPTWPEGILLGFQHYLVMLGSIVLISSVLVPFMGGGNVEKAEMIQTLLFAGAINTLLQTLFGTRLPVVVGPSYAFLIPAISTTFSRSLSIYADPHQRFKQSMRVMQGSVIVASTLQIILGFFGLWRIFARFLSPLSAVPLVTLTGLGLSAIGFPNLIKCVEIGLPALVILIILSQYIPQMMKSKGADRFAIIFTIIIVWAIAEILTAAGAYNGRSPKTQLSCRTDRSGLISAAPWLRVPYPFQWGRPSFNAGDVFVTLAASVVAIIESTGTFIAAARYGSATHIPPSVLSRGVGWLGIGTLVDGFLGTGVGSTASVEIWGFSCFNTIANCSSTVLCSLWLCGISWVWFSSVLQPQQLQDIVHLGLFHLHGSISFPVFHPGYISLWAWSCSYWLHHIQQHSASDFLIRTNCGTYSCLLFGLHCGL